MSTAEIALVFTLGLVACGPPEPAAPPASAVERAAPSAQPVAASAAPVVAVPSAKDIDLAAAKEPPQVWSYPTGGGEPVAMAGVVVVKEREGASLSGIAPATGERAWNLRAPVGVSFGSIEKGADAVYVGGYSPVGTTLSRVDPKTGKLVWHIEGPGEIALGHDGTGGVVRTKGCASRVISLASGRVIGKPFEDTMMEIHSFEMDGDTAPRFREQCRRATWPLLERRGVTLLSQGAFSRESLLGVNALGATSYTIATDGGHPRVAFTDGDEVVLLLLGSQIQALRVDVVSGAVRFRVPVADEASCEKDKAGYYAEAVRAPNGRPQLFVRGCGRATLLDAVSGAAQWTTTVGGDAAFLSGATAPWETPRSVELDAVGAVSARFFDRKGRLEKTIALPANVREVMPVAEGVVITESGLDVTAFYDESGLRWRLPLRFGNSFLLGERFLVLGSDRAAQVVIEPRTGSAFVVSGCSSARCPSGSPFALGQFGDLWLTTRAEPDQLFAVRPPS